MAPSASARPPTQTTHWVPKRSSKLRGGEGAGVVMLGRAGAAAGCGGETGAGGTVVAGSGFVGASAAGGSGAGCGAAGAGAATGAAGGAAVSLRSSAIRRPSSEASRPCRPLAFTSATMAMTGIARTRATTMRPRKISSIAARPRSNPAADAMRAGGLAEAGLVGGLLLVQVEPERITLVGDLAGTDHLDGADHAAVAAEQRVGKRDDAHIGLRRARGAADIPGDVELVARRIERAGGDEGAGRRAADAGIAMHHHGRGAIPVVHEGEQLTHMRILGHRIA